MNSPEKFFSTARAIGRHIPEAEIAHNIDILKKEGVAIFRGIDDAGNAIELPAFRLMKQDDKIIEVVELPRHVTDLGLIEEVSHLHQARRIGHEEFLRIQTSGPQVINAIKAGGQKRLEELLKAIPNRGERRKVIEEAKRYADLELQAKDVLISYLTRDALPGKGGKYTMQQWQAILSDLKEEQKRWRLWIQRLENVRY